MQRTNLSNKVRSRMVKLDFPISEYKKRLENVRKSIYAQGIDGLFVTNPCDIHYLSGSLLHKSGIRHEELIIPKDGDLVYIAPGLHESMVRDSTWIKDIRIYYDPHSRHAENDDPIRLIKQTFEELNLNEGTVGIQKSDKHGFMPILEYEKIRNALPKVNFIDASHIISSLRLIKSDKELEYVEKAVRICHKGARAGIRATKAGVYEYEIAAEIYNAIFKAGSDMPAGELNMGSGIRSAHVHAFHSEDKKVKKGDVVGFEFMGASHRYHSSLLRTVSIGPPKDVVKRIHDTCVNHFKRCMEFIKPGVTAEEVDRVGKKVIYDAGYGKYSYFKSGYGMGLGYVPSWGSEPLRFFEGNRIVLKPRMTFQIENAIQMYHLGFGVRVGGDTSVVTEDGCKPVVPIPEDLSMRLIIK